MKYRLHPLHSAHPYVLVVVTYIGCWRLLSSSWVSMKTQQIMGIIANSFQTSNSHTTVNFKLVVHKNTILRCKLTNRIRQTRQFCWMWLVNLKFKVAFLDNQPEIYGIMYCKWHDWQEGLGMRVVLYWYRIWKWDCVRLPDPMVWSCHETTRIFFAHLGLWLMLVCVHWNACHMWTPGCQD